MADETILALSDFGLFANLKELNLNNNDTLSVNISNLCCLLSVCQNSLEVLHLSRCGFQRD